MRKDSLGTWLTLKEAANRLNITTDEVRDLIDSGEIEGDEDEHGKIWALADDVEEMAAIMSPTNSPNPTPTPTPNPNPAPPPDPTPTPTPTRKLRPARKSAGSQPSTLNPQLSTPDAYADCPKSPSGAPLLTTAQAADLLKIGKGSVRVALNTGRLDGWKEDGLWLVHFDSVARYARKQGLYIEAGGATRYHYAERKRLEALQAGLLDYDDDAARASRLTPQDSQAAAHHSTLTPPTYWLSQQEAAATLRVSTVWMRKLEKTHKLTRETRRLPIYRGRRLLDRPPVLQTAYLMQEIVALMERRDDAVRTIGPAEWKMDLRRPVVRAVIKPSPGDRLISTKQAAEMLCVTRRTVNMHVANGRLFGWQKEPGKKGSRTFVSVRQVRRLQEDPEYVKHHAAATDGRKQPDCYVYDASPEWLLDNGLRDPDRVSRQPVSERSHGEYFNCAQAAKVLTTTTRRVSALRMRGRLKGHRSPRSNPRSKGAWWFYKKEDVYALLEDSAYLSARDRGRRATQKAKLPPEMTAEQMYEFIKINAFGRPPRGQIIETGWSWGDSRLYHISPFVRDPGDPPGGPWDPETWHEMLK